MPQCVELEFPIGYVADQLTIAVAGQAPPRATGWHITALIKASKELARGKTVDPNHYYCSEVSSDMSGLESQVPAGLFEMGNLWEAACRPAFSRWCHERFGFVSTGPSELIHEGIVANADALVLSPSTNSVVAVAECKFRYSHETDPTANDDWMRQVKGYCYILGVNAVWMVIGNVRQRPPGAASRIYMLTFYTEDIAENWHMLQNTRAYLNKMMEGA